MINKLEYLHAISEGKPDETPIYVHPQYQNCFQPSHENIQNFQEQLLTSFKRFENKKTLGIYNEQTLSYDHITYKDILQNSTAIGSSLSLEDSIIEVADSEGNKIKPVGIYMQNCREWTFVDMACILYGFTTCPIYETLGPQGVNYAMSLTQMSICFIDSKTAKFVQGTPNLKKVVCVGELDEETAKKLTNLNIQIIPFEVFLKKGLADIQPYPKITLNHAFTLVFTSGSTGLPKAVVWRHFNFACVLLSFLEGISQQFDETNICLQHIPMPHTSEKIVHLLALLNGAEINFTNSQLLEDLRKCKPTLMVTVPSIINLFYDEIQNWINQQENKVQLLEAIQIKIQIMQQTGSVIHDELDKHFQDAKKLIGGKLRLLVSMAAPISPMILDFLKVTLSCQILDFYGQTEIGFAMMISQNDTISGHVGGPSLYHQFKLISVPQMDYYTDVNVNGKVRGEICFKGKSVINGYWSNPTYTAETFDSDGWIHTGDIGEILNGRVRIIDRKNNLFKLSQGTWVTPQILEKTFRKLKGIVDVAIFGDNLKSSPVGIIVPDRDFLIYLSKQFNIEGDHRVLCTNSEIRKYFLNQLIKQSIESEFNDYETVSNVYLEPESFSSLGLKTETLKLQRHKAKIYYQNIINELYKELDQVK